MKLRLRQIAVVARDIAVVDELRSTFGLEVAFRDPGVAVFGLQNAVLPIGPQFLEVVSPVQPDTAGGRYLERRGGDGGYMVILQCFDHAPVKQRVDDLGIRKVIEEEDAKHGYSIMQLHPRDTGGSFLEIDVQQGGEDLDGPWTPAGASWQDAKRTDVVDAIVAAEIQSPDPDGLAQRWGAILDTPVTKDDAGTVALELDNATLRFVPDSDGRGEGLGGIDLRAVEPGRATDEPVVVAGLRVRLVSGT